MDYYLTSAIEKTEQLMKQIDEMEIPTELDNSVGDDLKGYLEALKQRAIALYESINSVGESQYDPDLYA